MSELSTPKRKQLGIVSRDNSTLNESPSSKYVLSRRQTTLDQFLCKPIKRRERCDSPCRGPSAHPPGRNLTQAYTPRSKKTRPKTVIKEHETVNAVRSTSRQAKDVAIESNNFCLKRRLCFFLILVLSMIIIGVLRQVTHPSCGHLTMNFTVLELALKEKVFGQHLAVNISLSRIKSYLEDTETFQPLVLSFHGWTGGGKNYMSSIIAENIPNVRQHKFIIPLHFPNPSNMKNNMYQHQITEWMKSNISNCAINLFIIDEMDKANPGLILGMQETLEELRDLKAKAKTIVIFLSNSQGKAINLFILDALREGRLREDITYSELSYLFESAAETNMWFHALHKKGLIDAYVPFLPLEKTHVKRCIERDLKEKGYAPSEKLVQYISEQMFYFPEELPIFSKSGCKRVNTKVDLSL
ncbi:torsin-1A-like [Lingula anatina]|uniref:Torsin-1A-like n=1 Tax=Lingula anatina TaxID=7574 RepID=A0A1S3KBX1_LINAN|nr:torsin-1A-like [Lingula anatina]|eukprot:XP_013419992.1 torsin-1A-like [Lingula anatina]